MDGVYYKKKKNKNPNRKYKTRRLCVCVCIIRDLFFISFTFLSIFFFRIIILRLLRKHNRCRPLLLQSLKHWIVKPVKLLCCLFCLNMQPCAATRHYALMRTVCIRWEGVAIFLSYIKMTTAAVCSKYIIQNNLEMPLRYFNSFIRVQPNCRLELILKLYLFPFITVINNIFRIIVMLCNSAFKMYSLVN